MLPQVRAMLPDRTLNACSQTWSRHAYDIIAWAPQLREVVRSSPKLPQAMRWTMVQCAGAGCSALRVHTGRGGGTLCRRFEPCRPQVDHYLPWG